MEEEDDDDDGDADDDDDVVVIKAAAKSQAAAKAAGRGVAKAEQLSALRKMAGRRRWREGRREEGQAGKVSAHDAQRGASAVRAKKGSEARGHHATRRAHGQWPVYGAAWGGCIGVCLRSLREIHSFMCPSPVR